MNLTFNAEEQLELMRIGPKASFIFGEKIEQDEYIAGLIYKAFCTECQTTNLVNDIRFSAAQDETAHITFTFKGETILYLSHLTCKFRDELIPNDLDRPQNVYNAFTEWLQLMQQGSA